MKTFTFSCSICRTSWPVTFSTPGPIGYPCPRCGALYDSYNNLIKPGADPAPRSQNHRENRPADAPENRSFDMSPESRAFRSKLTRGSQAYAKWRRFCDWINNYVPPTDPPKPISTPAPSPAAKSSRRTAPADTVVHDFVLDARQMARKENIPIWEAMSRLAQAKPDLHAEHVARATEMVDAKAENRRLRQEIRNKSILKENK